MPYTFLIASTKKVPSLAEEQRRAKPSYKTGIEHAFKRAISGSVSLISSCFTQHHKGVVIMINSRSTHYWLWFALFGLIAGIATKFNTETIVLTLTGLAGLILGFGGMARFGRGYDLFIGLIFTALGILGIVGALSLNGKLGIGLPTEIVGLSLAVPYNLIHTVLGLTSLNHGFKTTIAPTTVAVATPSQASAS
jgi:hypothetical protein